MTGPGFPVFLALNNLLGIPISLGVALFHIFAIVMFVAICHYFVRSYLISTMLLVLLLWNPVSFIKDMRRVFREDIYYGQTLLVLGLVIWVLYCPTRTQHRRLFATFAGGGLGWFWLTREEGLWIIPGLTILVFVSLLRIMRCRRDILRHPQALFRDQALRGLTVALSIVIGVFVLTQVTFNFVNWLAYGKFVGVDFKERNFQRALRAIDSVRSGGTKPFVSITQTAMQRVDTVSSEAFRDDSPPTLTARARHGRI